jgi:hypothetical protein
LKPEHIPGAYTATEIYHAYKNGADIVKVFPATSPSYLKDIAGPLPQIPLFAYQRRHIFKDLLGGTTHMSLYTLACEITGINIMGAMDADEALIKGQQIIFQNTFRDI